MALTDQTEDLNILNPDNIQLEINGEQEVTLKLKREEKVFEDVEINPAFPLTKIGRYLSVRKPRDQKNKIGDEIGIIKDMEELDKDSKNVLDQALEKIYFMPKINKIYEIEEEYGVTCWEVKTEKGRRAFDIKSRRKDTNFK